MRGSAKLLIWLVVAATVGVVFFLFGMGSGYMWGEPDLKRQADWLAQRVTRIVAPGHCEANCACPVPGDPEMWRELFCAVVTPTELMSGKHLEQCFDLPTPSAIGTLDPCTENALWRDLLYHNWLVRPALPKPIGAKTMPNTERLDDRIGQTITLRGTALEAKGGPVLKTATGEVIYVLGVSDWPGEGRQGPVVRVRGILHRRKLIPDPKVDEDGAISQGAEGSQWVLEGTEILPDRPPTDAIP